MLFQERKQIVICVLATAVIGGFLLFRYIPLRKRVKAVEQAKAAQALVIAKVSADSQQLPLLEEQLLKLHAKVAYYQANVPMQRDHGVFLRKIADLMKEHNLKEEVLAPGNEIQADELRCIPIDMQCKGKLVQIFEFYKQLQRLNRLVRIERVELVNDNGFGGEVSMRTKAVIYYRAEVGQG